MADDSSRAREALGMARLLNRETRHHPAAADQRQAQRQGGQSGWELRDELVAEDLRGVIADAPPAPEADGLADYDRPLPMAPAPDERAVQGVAVSGGIRVLTVRRVG